MNLALKFLAVPTVGFVLLAGLFASTPAQAQIDLTTGLSDVGDEAFGSGGRTLEETLGSLIQAVLGFLGIVFLVLVLYAGGLWMTAAGNTDNVEKAKKLLVQAVIGLVIILSAYAISEFVITELGNATTT